MLRIDSCSALDPLALAIGVQSPAAGRSDFRRPVSSAGFARRCRLQWDEGISYGAKGIVPSRSTSVAKERPPRHVGSHVVPMKPASTFNVRLVRFEAA
jgi:hypothetical protein